MVTFNTDALGEVVFQAWQSAVVNNSELKYNDLQNKEKQLYQLIGIKVSTYVIAQIELEQQRSGASQDGSLVLSSENTTAITPLDDNDNPTYLGNLEKATIPQLEKKLSYFKETANDLEDITSRLEEYLAQRRGSIPFDAESLVLLLEKRLSYAPKDFLLNMASLYVTKNKAEVSSRIKDLEFLYQQGIEDSTFLELNIAYFVLRLLMVYEVESMP